MEFSQVPGPVIAALVMSALSLVLSGVAYWRAGGRRDVAQLKTELKHEIESWRMRQRQFAEDLSRRIRSGYEDTLSRVKRGQQRLSELKTEMATSFHDRIDAVSHQLHEVKREADEGIERLKHDVTASAQAAQEALARRMRRLEGRIQILVARAEMVRAERLADKREFIEAERKLEDAVAKVREVKARLADDFEEDPAFTEVIHALQAAIKAVRLEARDHKREIESVLAASDHLLAALQEREQRIV